MQKPAPGPSIRGIAKAIAGAVAGGVTAPGLMLVAFPDDVSVPWWGYLLAAVINAGITALTVYWAPRNRETLPGVLPMLLALPVLLVLSACSTASDLVSSYTGTTLEQRCANYRLLLDQWELYRRGGGEMTPAREAMIGAGQAFLATNCGPPQLE